MSEPLPQEIEAKFLIPDARQVDFLRTGVELAPGYRLGPAAEIAVEDVYLDTADLRLLRGGFGLRVRTKDDQREAALKSRRIGATGGIFRRTEVEAPLAEDAMIDSLAGWPEELLAVLSPLIALDARLAPLCVLRQRRLKRAILADRRARPAKGKARPVALGELSIDDVAICGSVEGPVLVRASELEMELGQGIDERELETLVAALEPRLRLEPSPQSKLEYALGVVSRHPAAAPQNWQGIEPAMHMAEACRLIWQEQFTAMLLAEAGVRYSSDPEYVHDMRVATRRARAAARLYGGFFQRKAVRRYLKALRRTAQLLGAVRDLDVAIGKLERFAGAPQSYAGRGVAGQLEQWRDRRIAAHTELLAWLDSPQYARFVADFTRFCSTPGAGAREYPLIPGNEPAPYQVRHVTPSMILSRFERVRSFEILFEQPGDPPPELLHMLRIECKYLRYNLEFVANLLGPSGRRLVNDLRRLQGCLGELNDAAVSKRMIAESGEPAVGNLMRYQRSQDRVIRRLSRRVAADLRRFVSPSSRQRLAMAIAAI